MKGRLGSGKGLRRKLFIPVLIQIIVLAVFLIVIFSAMDTSRKNLEETAKITAMAAEVRILKAVTSEQLYNPFPTIERNEMFHNHVDQLKEKLSKDSPLYSSIDTMGSLFDEIGTYKQRNLEIEDRIMELTEASMTQSDGYIERVVEKLNDPLRANEVTSLEKQVILGAHRNTSLNYTIQKLFYRVSYDSTVKDQLRDFIKAALDNSAADIENLKNTPFRSMPVAAHESNKKIESLVNEYIDNINSIRSAGLQLNNLLSAFDSDLSQEATRLQESTVQKVSSSFLLIGIIITAASVLIALISTFLGIRISRTVRRTANMLKDISQGEGDLTGRLKITTKDEIGDLARYFNETMDNIESMIRVLQKESATLKDIGTDLSSSMTQTAASVHQITANINRVKSRIMNQSAGVTKTDETVTRITGNIKDLNSSIEEQSAGVVESSSAVEEMVANISSVTGILEKNSQAFRELLSASELGSTRMEDVSSLVQAIARDSEGLIEASTIIENIADQTNLLAMNAAIEAAHAGESGKGFAVVADEIRKLAENSGVQGKSISEVLTKLKDAIDRVSESSRSAQQQFSHVVDLTKTVNEQEQVIKNAMEEQNTGSTQVLEAIRRINDITSQVKSGSTDMLADSREIIAEMKRLSEITEEITGSMDEMAIGTEEINTAVHHVNDISKQNEESIHTLSSEILRFKVAE